ncbi:hypothetical protein ILYODFUR_026381 [Ilyodon furcidens]|uniref:Uncharacterized protein n=1 Tax=Ilyodon furcidens TaxID=33524 RepID=A0ABV0TPD9_9TELE
MVVGSVVHCEVCLTALLPRGVSVRLSVGRACAYAGLELAFGLPFWVGCFLLAASVLVWGMFCCPACLVVAGVWCRASGTGRSVGSAPWFGGGWACWSCALLCMVYSGCGGPAGLLFFLWWGCTLGQCCACFRLAPFCWGVVAPSGIGLGRGWESGFEGLDGYGRARGVGPGFRSVLGAWCLPLAFRPMDVPMPPSLVGPRRTEVPIGVSRGAGSPGEHFAPQSFPPHPHTPPSSHSITLPLM